MNYRNEDRIFRFANDKYSNNNTMLEIYDAQLSEIDVNENLIYRSFLNNFVKYCDVEGIRRFEAIFFIQADEENETLEFRRARIYNKFAQLPPYTKIFMEQMLETLFGADNFEFDVNYNEYKVFVGIETDIEGLVTQTLKDIRQIIPANMIIQTIVYIPYIHNYLKRHYTHNELAQFTQGVLSQYAT